MTDWTLVAAVLGVGLLLGGALYFFLGRRGAADPDAAEALDADPARALEADPLRDLEAERDLLLSQLRALDLEAGEAVAEERYARELRAARVLRALAAERARRPAAKAPLPSASTARGFAWGLGSAAFAVLLVALVLQSSQERAEGAPITGAPLGAVEAGEAAEPEDPELLAFIARVEQEPENHAARLDLVQALLARERFVDAWPFIHELSNVMPDEPRLLLYEATVREAMGQWERARALLDRALAGDEGLTEAWVRRGLVSFELGEWAVAVASWEKALEQRPDGRAVLEPVIAEAERRVAEGTPPPAREPAGEAPGVPPASGAPPVAAAAPAQQAAEAGVVRVRVELSEAAKERADGQLLFVTARPAGVRAGPPAAAKRIPVEAFPLEFELGPADSMMGQPFPSPARIEARLDRDGNAMSQTPDEPRAAADDVEPGAELTLVLE